MMCMFESVFCAQKAKAALNGADIYAGCCTLKIEYARVMLGPSLLILLEKLYIYIYVYDLTFFTFTLFEQPTRLNVIRNDNDSWDYTKPYLGRRGRFSYVIAVDV